MLEQQNAPRDTSQAHPSAAQAQYGYTFEDEMDEVDDDDDDDDARSAATGMSGPSKYAPSGYAPSSHHGVSHDLMSQYEPSVYEADSAYDPSLYGRESAFEDESAYSYGQDSRSGRGGHHGHARRHVSGRISVTDTAAASHLGSVMEMDDGDDRDESAYAPSESYVSSYVSSEDEEGLPSRSIHPTGPHEGRGSPRSGYNSRHNARRSGQEISGGQSGFSQSSGAASSSRHTAGRSGFDDSEGYTENYGDGPVMLEELDYYEDEHGGEVARSPGEVEDVNKKEASSSGW